MRTPIGWNGIDFSSAALLRPGFLEVRRLSGAAEAFRDGGAVRERLREGDPVLYERRCPPDPPWPHLTYEVTILYPGRAGDEFFGTEGQCLEGPALWIGLRGEGRLLRAPEEVLAAGGGVAVGLEPGRAFRTVNVGRSDLVYLLIRPGGPARPAASGAFRAAIVAGADGAPVVVEAR